MLAEHQHKWDINYTQWKGQVAPPPPKKKFWVRAWFSSHFCQLRRRTQTSEHITVLVKVFWFSLFTSFMAPISVQQFVYFKWNVKRSVQLVMWADCLSLPRRNVLPSVWWSCIIYIQYNDCGSMWNMVWPRWLNIFTTYRLAYNSWLLC